MRSGSSYEISFPSSSNAFRQAPPLYLRHNTEHVSLNQNNEKNCKKIKQI